MKIIRSNERGKSDLGWLLSRFSYSFAEYWDPARMGFGLLRVFNDDTIAPKAGFPMHEHRNMEIITIVLSGEISHNDSGGGSGVTKAGDVQVMSAGTGVLHSEMNAHPTLPCELFQIWIHTKMQNSKPKYASKTFALTERVGRCQLLVEGTQHDGTLMIGQDSFISRGIFEKGDTVPISRYEATNGLVLMNVKGELVCANEHIFLRDMIEFLPGEFPDKLVASSDVDLLLIEVPMK